MEFLGCCCFFASLGERAPQGGCDFLDILGRFCIGRADQQRCLVANAFLDLLVLTHHADHRRLEAQEILASLEQGFIGLFALGDGRGHIHHDRDVF